MDAPALPPAGSPAQPTGFGPRAARTREAIVDAARALFLERGYAGLRVADITEACGISRAGFYTYFRDKREVFAILGRASYREVRQVVSRWEDLPRPCTPADVAGWIGEYFAYMDRHGAFVLASALSAPPDADFRADARRTRMRAAAALGRLLQARKLDAGGTTDTLGLVVLAMLERCWEQLQAPDPVVHHTDLVAAAAVMICGLLGEPGPNYAQPA